MTHQETMWRGGRVLAMLEALEEVATARRDGDLATIERAEERARLAGDTSQEVPLFVRERH